MNNLGFFLVRIFLKVFTEGPSILHVFDEDIVAYEIFSFRFVLCSMWLYLGIHLIVARSFLFHF